MFEPLNTSDGSASHRKVLLYANHGWGKTTQAKHYKRTYGKGLIISGESGLASIASEGIDYFPFSSWDGEVDAAKRKYSFVSIVKWMMTQEFKDRDYKWVMIDSLTELSDLAYAKAEADAQRNAKDGKVNGFAIYEDHNSMIIGACKFIRDMPMHMIVTALAKESEDENGNKTHWPMVKGKQLQQQLPGIFDCVLCGIKRTAGVPDASGNVGNVRTEHYILTDEVRGWKGKVRDENRRLSAVEHESDVTKLLQRMAMPDDEYQSWLKSKQA